MEYRPVGQRPRLFIVDVDGTIFKQRWPLIHESSEPLPGVVNKLHQWYTDGDHIMLVTARPEIYRQMTEAQLLRADIFYHTLIMGLPTGQRILVNDGKPQESDVPMAVAVNLIRDEGFGGIDL